MKKIYSEIIGTFAMVFCGCGAMTINEITNGIEGRLLSDLSKIPKDDLYQKTKKIRTSQ